MNLNYQAFSKNVENSLEIMRRRGIEKLTCDTDIERRFLYLKTIAKESKDERAKKKFNRAYKVYERYLRKKFN